MQFTGDAELTKISHPDPHAELKAAVCDAVAAANSHNWCVPQEIANIRIAHDKLVEAQRPPSQYAALRKAWGLVRAQNDTVYAGGNVEAELDKLEAKEREGG